MSFRTSSATNDGSLFRSNWNRSNDPMSECQESHDAIIIASAHNSMPLIDRDSELKALQDLKMSILPRETKSNRRIGLVHGVSGCGKTVLCKAALSLKPSGHHQPNDLQDEMFVIQGKYNQIVTATTTPYSAIIDAFDTLGKQVEEKDCASQMKLCLQFEASLLTKLIPSFRIYNSSEEGISRDDPNGLVVMNSPDEEDAGNTDKLIKATERLTVAFQSFLRKFTALVRPLAFFLDDLQWSDRYSQELRKFLSRTYCLHDMCSWIIHSELYFYLACAVLFFSGCHSAR